MRAVLQLTMFAALVLVWLAVDKLKRKRTRSSHQMKQHGKEF
jgi:hypothetical protein